MGQKQKETGMTPQEFEVLSLRRDLEAAETEVRECRKHLIREILELFKIEEMAKKDIERVIRGML
jgi:hypothetical protein